MTRTLLFLDYWSLHEPLTQSTVLPTLRMVQEEGLADRILLVTVERGARAVHTASELWPGVQHVPVVASTLPLRPLARAFDAWSIPGRVATLAHQHEARYIMARGVVAGGMAHRVHERTGLPYSVDYFEPHNDYMTDVGEWRKGGMLDRGLARMIRQQARTARFCVTVSDNYRVRLIAQGVDGKRILVAPCPVDAQRMRFNPADRSAVRNSLGLDADAPVGVYVGKFGGLYHREQAFRAFAEAQRLCGARFGMIVLTPEDKNAVEEGIRQAGFRGDGLLVRYAEHHEVPAHLSAADFAFAPYRGTPSSACISPMKIGEYWANGLPVVLTKGVGDDSGIISREPLAGALFDPEGHDLPKALDHIHSLLAISGQRASTADLAGRYRGMDHTITAYCSILSGVWV